MNKEEIIEYCLTLENTFKDCPFSDDFESVTMKHCKNKKWFALIMNVNNKLYLNVKKMAKNILGSLIQEEITQLLLVLPMKILHTKKQPLTRLMELKLQVLKAEMITA